VLTTLKHSLISKKVEHKYNDHGRYRNRFLELFKASFSSPVIIQPRSTDWFYLLPD